MNFGWNHVFDYFKDRRYAALFISALAAVFLLLAGVAGLAQLFRTRESQECLPYMAVLLTIMTAVWMWRGFRLASRQSECVRSQLSPDELTKARSKLFKRKN